VAGLPRGLSAAVIFHITARDEWEAAAASGSYVAAGFAHEGFMHLSTRELPHLYGPLNLDAVACVTPLAEGPDGFALPPQAA
jgi:uncharacterized protein (DUF952 family)